jgi:hypothetical protein
MEGEACGLKPLMVVLAAGRYCSKATGNYGSQAEGEQGAWTAAHAYFAAWNRTAAALDEPCRHFCDMPYHATPRHAMPC